MLFLNVFIRNNFILSLEKANKKIQIFYILGVFVTSILPGKRRLFIRTIDGLRIGNGAQGLFVAHMIPGVGKNTSL